MLEGRAKVPVGEVHHEEDYEKLVSGINIVKVKNGAFLTLHASFLYSDFDVHSPVLLTCDLMYNSTSDLRLNAYLCFLPTTLCVPVLLTYYLMYNSTSDLRLNAYLCFLPTTLCVLLILTCDCLLHEVSL